WEFVQLLFPAGSVTEALATEPLSVGYAQHEGGESADWHDDKLRRDGTHPVVYSSQRSHASYFAPAVYIGRSASEGFGCDHTEAPSTRIEPDVVVLPDRVERADDPLAWIGFEGRWGERHGGPNNGPTGPNTKPQWSDSVAWQSELRDSSFVVPGDDTSAAQVIDAFCGIVGWGSVQYINFVASPVRVLFALAVLGAAVAFLVRRTSWTRVAATPLRRRRRAGEILRLAAAELRRHPATFASAAALAIPIAMLAALLGIVFSHAPVIGAFVEVADPTDAGARLVSSTIIASAVIVLPYTLISALVAGLLDDTGGARTNIGAAWSSVRRRAGALSTALLLAVVSVVLVSFTVVGLPIAVWLFVRWLFLPQAVVLDHCGGRAALAHSARLVGRRWWHTALVAAVTLGIVSAFGLAVGLVLLVLFTGLPLWALSAIVATCNMLAMPYGAVVMTFLYGNAVSADSAAVAHDEEWERV
ncbi:MAG: Vps62-related protein, partial [Ilumatobacteraceae bacterium]